jgi:hypothetical protein
MKKNLKKKTKTRNPRAGNTTIARSMVQHAELKYLDLTTFDANITGGGTVYVLSNVPQGPTQSQRIGDFIQPVRWRVNVTVYQSNADVVATIRLIWFRWIPLNTSTPTPTIANILEAPSSSQCYSQLNFQLQDNYQILSDWVIGMSGTATAPTNSSAFTRFNMKIPLKTNKVIEFNLGTQYGTGQLFLLAISDSSASPYPQLNLNSRLYYEDTVREVPSHRII